MEIITVQTSKQKEIVDITNQVEELLAKLTVKGGLINLFLQHTTAAITTTDLDLGTDLDMLDAFDKIIPKLNYRHPHDPTHVPDHILSSIIGPSLTIPFENGKLLLGEWQKVVLIELDGPKERKIVVSKW